MTNHNIDHQIVSILTMNPNPLHYQVIANRIQTANPDGYMNGIVWIALNRLLTKGLVEQIDENLFKIKSL